MRIVGTKGQKKHGKVPTEKKKIRDLPTSSTDVLNRGSCVDSLVRVTFAHGERLAGFLTENRNRVDASTQGPVLGIRVNDGSSRLRENRMKSNRKEAKVDRCLLACGKSYAVTRKKGVSSEC